MKHHWVLTVITAAVSAALPLAADARAAEELKPSEPAPMFEVEDYGIELTSGEAIDRPEPELPDVSQYNREAVEKRLSERANERPDVSVERIADVSALGDFVDEGRAREWVIRQYSHPQAILVNSGKATLDDVYRQVNDARYMERNEDGSYIIRLPLVVRPGATLEIREQTLRLSEERGAFIANDSWLFVIDSTIIGWREKAEGPATYQKKSNFRPFFVGWGGSETFVLGSEFAHLGYNQSKSYGFSIAQYSKYDNAKLKRSAPHAWLIESTFRDIYYGFYCYEAEDVAIVNNTYRDNIVYGIDPHDYSSNLLIAGNHVFDTIEKHGIIISREVNDSWIINNRSHDNGLSGIVLDRQSSNNVVANNVVHDNHGDGIGLYESPDNLLWGNRLINNLRNGIRVRNSTNVGVFHNIAALNGTFGVLGQIKDLSATDRNFVEDFYHQAVSLTVVGGKLASNASGPMSTDNPQYIELYNVDMRFPRSDVGIHFDGVLGAYQTEIFDALLNNHRAVRLTPVGD
ncbi:right-handed parallel beta-helix repeat-containing protein [Marinobacter sp. BW6]|uniref:right-handed parallel beta-helix repeat-containing protein n=1 Tax=Marinobacter sp. BW6 TaxID=2592624 RepID=UPI0011DE659E|nr:right-handed parallel beta-helix repeat-containing protein [Marinobacter sp. BW6]TYC55578.1 right-handed parallel beta-helix repeat-containing protein [Marinobacter sp. BW6]